MTPGSSPGAGSPWPRDALYHVANGARAWPVRVVGETERRYVIEADRDVSLSGGRWLKPGDTARVMKRSIVFVPPDQVRARRRRA